MRQIDRAKEDPRQTNPVNCQEPGEPPENGSRARRGNMFLHLAHIGQNIFPVRPNPMDDQGDTMQTTPDHEGPGAAMPEASEEHRDHDVAIDKPGRPAISTQRYVEVITKPGRK